MQNTNIETMTNFRRYPFFFFPAEFPPRNIAIVYYILYAAGNSAETEKI